VRRCLGASFAQFEMKIVLRELVSRLDIRAARPDPERRIRRAIVFAPERGGEIVVDRRRGGAATEQAAASALAAR
jgi:cytochrome P450